MFLVVGQCKASDLQLLPETRFVTIEQNPLEISMDARRKGTTSSVYVLVPDGGPSALALAQELADYLRVTFEISAADGIWCRRRQAVTLNKFAFGRQRIVSECFSQPKKNQSEEQKTEEGE
jgi:hypothetical protein